MNPVDSTIILELIKNDEELKSIFTAKIKDAMKQIDTESIADAISSLINDEIATYSENDQFSDMLYDSINDYLIKLMRKKLK